MEYHRLHPALAHAYDAYLTSGRQALADHVEARGLVGFVSLTAADAPKPPRVVVAVSCDPATAFDAFDDTGIEVNEGGPCVRTAIVPMDDLPGLSAHPGVRWIEPAALVFPHMDIAPGKVGLPAFATKTGTTGKGVLIGVVDSGIDAAHPDFGTRVLRIWDQTVEGTGVPEGQYGTEYTERSQFVKSPDTTGHGTLVAGVAAGAGKVYKGIAPDADLLIVKTNFTTVGAIDAVHYLARLAKDLKRPLVINLSFGNQAHAHDGSDPVSKAVDGVSAQGVVVCCSAGDQGSVPSHSQVQVGTDEQLIPCNYGFNEKYGPFSAAGWYPGQDGVEFALVGPGGKKTDYLSPPPAKEKPVQLTTTMDGWSLVLTSGNDENNGDRYIAVSAKPPSSQADAHSLWKIAVRGKGSSDDRTSRLDMWCFGDVYFAGPTSTPGVMIAAPGCAKKAITVGSYVTRKRWTDIDKLDWQISGLTENGAAPDTGQGPLRDGSPKPDLLAPGTLIISCLSTAMNPKPTPDDTPDSTHVLTAGGTSMASAFVAGVAALLLEKEPTLDSAKILSELHYNPASNAKHDKNVWGRGLLELDTM